MIKGLLIAAVVGVALLLVGLAAAPILVYRVGIPWLPAIPKASDSQLGLLYFIDTPLIGATVGLLGLTFRFALSWIRNHGQAMPKPQAKRASGPHTQPTHPDPIVIGGGRERRNFEFGAILILASVYILIGFAVAIAAPSHPSQEQGYLIGSGVYVVLGLVFILTAFITRIGTRLPCLKIWSTGIEYIVERERFFIPWGEITRVYIDLAPFNEKLYVRLVDNSRFYFQKSIKSRYKDGAIDICSVSVLPNDLIPEHLVVMALNIHTPPDIAR